jgi:hypothetical protein
VRRHRQSRPGTLRSGRTAPLGCLDLVGQRLLHGLIDGGPELRQGVRFLFLHVVLDVRSQLAENRIDGCGGTVHGLELGNEVSPVRVRRRGRLARRAYSPATTTTACSGENTFSRAHPKRLATAAWVPSLVESYDDIVGAVRGPSCEAGKDPLWLKDAGSSQPVGAFEPSIQGEAHEHGQGEDNRVTEDVLGFWHVLEIHAVDRADDGRKSTDGQPG